MSVSISSLTSLSLFSSSSFHPLADKPASLRLPVSRKPSALRAAVDSPEEEDDPYAVDSPEEEEDDRYYVEELVKSRLPGGFAAQPIHGTGRRKRASARVVLQEGTGQVYINYREAKDYLQGNPLWLQYVKVPLTLLGYETSYDVFVKVQGGGLGGQSQAITLGVARALLKINPNLRPPLREQGLLTRDDRQVERKKVGLHKARKRPQYSKR